MYYITKRDSETGKKFQEVEKNSELAFEAQKKMAEKYGFDSWRRSFHVVFGGISSCIFKEAPDPKIWKKVNGNEFFPKYSSKVGALIAQEFSELPKVHVDTLNKCIGWEGQNFSHIGFSSSNKEYFGFTTNEKWDIAIPEDCEEITYKRYKELFKEA